MINDEEVLHTKNLYKHKNVRQFKDDLDYLLKEFKPIRLRNLLKRIDNGFLIPANRFLLTFDDGFREMYDIVAPILLEKGIEAIFFLNSDFIDNKTLCHQHKASILVENIKRKTSRNIERKVMDLLAEKKIYCNNIEVGILAIKYDQRDVIDQIGQVMDVNFDEYLLKNIPYLTSSQVREMIKKGFAIGAHSIDHPLYSSLSLEQQLYQTEESVKFIRDKFDLDYSIFAFPHNDNMVSKEFFKNLYGRGLVHVSFGTNGMIEDECYRNIQRVSFEKPLIPAKKIVAYQFARKVYRTLTGKSVVRTH
jgi:peptidoglycan/xylan/chitin deacetylase (PgdA/CDA1 family)